ncbi:MAG: hypothetical protein ACYDC3_00240 [Candidatus Binataceae bacterium]
MRVQKPVNVRISVKNDASTGEVAPIVLYVLGLYLATFFELLPKVVDQVRE